MNAENVTGRQSITVEVIMTGFTSSFGLFTLDYQIVVRKEIINMHWFYKIKSQPIREFISEMNINFSTEETKYCTLESEIDVGQGINIGPGR